MNQDKDKLYYKNKQKLLPKDISESLGKLPPQAIDMEEAVLGALMLEKSGLPVVSKFLKADHFYKDAHQEIYKAAIDLQESGEPVDMRTLRNKLAKTGKIELVGGAYYIAELTGKVSGASNIEAHARVIVEMAIKRQLITIASRIHQEAYEDTTDCFNLLDNTLENLTKFRDTTTLENTEEKTKALWKERMLVEQPPPEIPLITINGATIATAGNHSLILGKKKSRKTLFITWLIHQYFQQNRGKNDDILLFDTEQGKSHVWKVKQKIKKLTGFDLPIFTLRGMAPADRREFVANTVKYWPIKPKIVVLDGVRDFMSNINDADETTEVIVWLEKLILGYSLHIMEILHLNKTDNNARGHIGSELLNKAEVTIELEKDEKSGVTIVKCESSREKDFETFSFTHGIDDLPEIVGTPLKGNAIPVDERRLRLIAAFADGSMSYKELIPEIKAQFNIGKTRAEALVREFTRAGWITKSGNPRDPKAIYKILITTDSSSDPLPPAPAKDLQQEMFLPIPPTVDELSEDLPF